MNRIGRGLPLDAGDEKAIVRLERRLMLKQALGLGALALLGGCDVTDRPGMQRVLGWMSSWNDRSQALLYDPRRLAPEFTPDRVVTPFPFNAYYGRDEVRQVDGAAYALEVTGLVRGRRRWTLPELAALPQASQITRLICVEGWSAIGQWAGVRLSDFLAGAGADVSARYVGFQCADGYYGSIDMPSALHPQTLLALRFAGHALPPEYGYPLRLRIPTKLGFKNPKHVTAITVTNRNPGGYWEDQGYNWFSGS